MCVVRFMVDHMTSTTANSTSMVSSVKARATDQWEQQQRATRRDQWKQRPEDDDEPPSPPLPLDVVCAPCFRLMLFCENARLRDGGALSTALDGVWQRWRDASSEAARGEWSVMGSIAGGASTGLPAMCVCAPNWGDQVIDCEWRPGPWTWLRLWLRLRLLPGLVTCCVCPPLVAPPGAAA